MKKLMYLITLLVFSVAHTTFGAQNAMDDLNRSLQSIPRDIPRPAPNHPGNIFVLGENITVPVSDRIKVQVNSYRVLDDKQNVIQENPLAQSSNRLDLGKLGIGWYRIEFLNAENKILVWTTAAVIHPLSEPVPQDSPICIDSATAWFASNDPAKQENFARLAALAGANWIRDRLTWSGIQKTPDTYVSNTTYDTSADLQAKHGLKVLQVFHHTPGWAHNRELDGPGAGSRFPRDLRLLYNFCLEMAQRYQGKILAWEPWNEANITVFGGHTIDEMCAHQKAAYLGFKAGDPDLTVCWNTYAGSGTPLHTEGVLLNEAWPYFDTYNIHTYWTPEQYLDEFATAREAACGRPIWLSECGIGLKYQSQTSGHELSREDELRQAKFIARSYASSFYAGVNRHFFFILGNYPERDVQFGLLRHDLTPRPGYVAYAAVARFLAGAKSIGRYIPHNSNDLRLYAFRSQSDSQKRDILIIWAEKPTKWKLPVNLQPQEIYDYLGHPLKQLPDQLGIDAVFVQLPAGQANKLNLEPPKRSSAYRVGKTSPVVLQLQMPHTVTNLDRQAHIVDVGRSVPLKLFAYNFAEREISAMFHVEHCPNNWQVEPRNWKIRLKPMERKALQLRVTLPAQGREIAMGQWLKIRGTIPDGGESLFAFRLMGDMNALEPQVRKSISSADQVRSWQDNINAKATMHHQAHPDGGIQFNMQFADTDPWGYPKLPLQPEDIPTGSLDGLALTIQILEGAGDVRIQFIEKNGASYITDVGIRTDIRKPQKAVVLFDSVRWGEWSQPDPDKHLTLQDMRQILIGINSKKNSTVKMVIRDLDWIQF
jgi:hypothetical protein